MKKSSSIRVSLTNTVAGAAIITGLGALFIASQITLDQRNPGVRMMPDTLTQIRLPDNVKLEQVVEMKRPFKVLALPRPSPSNGPEIYNLRRCECRQDWKETMAADPGGTVSLCTCGGRQCPAKVNPKFLTAALGQDNCSLKRQTGYNCYTHCTDDGRVLWYAEQCGPGHRDCDPLVSTPTRTPTGTKTNPPPISVPQVTWDPRLVMDLRGAGCELKNGREQCYMLDAQGRENCPDYVTSEYLAFPRIGEHSLCQPERARDFYCTIQCQDGNPVVRWGYHDVKWCYAKENYGNCPMRPSVIPQAEWTLRPWSAPEDVLIPCRAAAKYGGKPSMIKDLTVGLLTHEPRSFADSMATYEKHGLFDIVPEFIIYANTRSPQIDAVAQVYIDRYPGKVRILGDSTNIGIARGIVQLTNNAKYPYFLFLERDFQLIEPGTCVEEQLNAGMELLKAKAADVVRYRSRWHAGRPNWAVRMFKGHEEDAFYHVQPNLVCNHFYWIPDPEVRWPDKFWKCGEDPYMICSDSFYCNWTNNPQMWSIEWWNREYVSNFDHFLRNDPWYDLESYMNWEPNSWNDRGFTVAQGEGLFKHMDRGNIVHV